MQARNIDLTRGPIGFSLLRFALPLVLTSLLQQLYNTVDLLIVGQFAGPLDMAAIGVTGSLTALIVALFVGLSTGASVLSAQYYGARDVENLQKTVHTTYAISIYGGLAITLLTLLFTPLMLRLMDTPAEILQKSINYMRITFAGIIPIMVYNMGSGILRSIGDSQRPFNYLMVSSGLNFILDLVFVGLLKKGAEGAGIATALAQSISGILVTLNLSHTNDIYRLDLKKIAFHRDILNRVTGIGLPVGLQSAGINLSNVIIQSRINLFGPAAISGSAGSGRLDGFIFMGFFALANAATTFTAQNIGAKKHDRIKRGSWVSVAMVLIFCLLVSLFVYLARVPLMKLFSQDQEVVAYGARMLAILAPFYWMSGLTEVLSGLIRGSGKTFPTMVISMISMFGFRLVWVLFALPIWQTIDVVFLSYPISWSLTLLLTLLYYKFGKWRPSQEKDQVPGL
ncbi:MAG: MATE family efflux transporter [Tissierellia bacterium]|nr:MATE family efflux transporter [Tissierellia bacterium]